MNRIHDYRQFLALLVYVKTNLEAGAIIKDNPGHYKTACDKEEILDVHVIIDEHRYVQFVLKFEMLVTYKEKDKHSSVHPVLDAFARMRGHLKGLDVDESFIKVYLEEVAAELGKTVDELQFDFKQGIV